MTITRKKTTWFTKTKVYLLLHVVVGNKKEQCLRNDTIASVKEKKMSLGERIEAETDLEFSFTFSMALLHTFFFAGSVPLFRICGWHHFPRRTPKEWLQHSSVFTSSWMVFQFVFTLSRFQRNSHPFRFQSRALITTFSFESSSANQNSLSIRCWYVSIFKPGFHNYFIL